MKKQSQQEGILTLSKEIHINGTPICRGIAIGTLAVFTRQEHLVPEFTLSPDRIELEIIRFRQALSKGKSEVKVLQERLRKDRVVEGVAILDGHLQIMEDPMITTEVEEQIRSLKKNAEHVFESIIKKFKERFESIEDPFFRERFKDIEEISRRIFNHLSNSVRVPLDYIPPNSIVLANDLTIFDTAEIDDSRACAFITKHGGVASHAAIVAKGKGIPYVSSVDLEKIHGAIGSSAIVDGRTGRIIINPSDATLAKYTGIKEQLHEHFTSLSKKGGLQSETYDGYRIQLCANVDLLGDLDTLQQFRGHGIGLLRTESEYVGAKTLPSEEEQYALYRQFVERMVPETIVIRTFDFGGDKFLPRQHQKQESNPFLGFRAIRLMLKERELFKIQLRAILRAATHGRVHLMFPMISSVAELMEAKEILEEAKFELRKKGIDYPADMKIGCMIEVPSAAMTADLLAKECDFLSIGTNDLVQYTLAVDRTNSNLNYLYAPAHPAILRLIRYVVGAANGYGVPVAICGEVASDPRFTPILLGLGVSELSVAPRSLPRIKNAIRNTSIVTASRQAEYALSLSSSAEIEHFLTAEYNRSNPEDSLYNI
jgi:phosphotransferase system enzyme I (PtsI)